MSGSDRPDASLAWEAMAINAADNVAVALCDIEGDVHVRIGDAVRVMHVAAPIPMGHKFATRDLTAGEPVLKYGECIGITTAPVAAGEHVHVHNLESRRARRKAG